MKGKTSGQALLIALFVGLVLVLSIPIVVILTQAGTKHQTFFQKKTRANAVAEEGISYAAQMLSTQWVGALAGTFPDECDGSHYITGTSGAKFTLLCDRPAGIPSYQVRVHSTAYLPGFRGSLSAMKTMEAYLSRKTLGASLASGMRTGAALTLARIPLQNPLAASKLDVHWGPVLCLDATAIPPPDWTLSDPMDQITLGNQLYTGYPRKFSVGGLTGAVTRSGRTSPPHEIPMGEKIMTDQKEYWAFASLSFPPVIDESNNPSPAPPGYTLLSKRNTPPYTLAPAGNSGGGGSVTQNPPQSGFYEITPPGVAVFDNTFTSPTPPPTDSVIYVTNPDPLGAPAQVQFNNLGLDLQNGAIIINGDLTLQGSGNGLSLTDLKIPPSAPTEYYYWDNPTVKTPFWPCRPQCNPAAGSEVCGNQPTTCTIEQAMGNGGRVNFRGFLWVKGNLHVVGPGWVIVGTVLVGDPYSITPTTSGQLDITSGELKIFYDETINRGIRMSPLTAGAVELQIDSMKELPPS